MTTLTFRATYFSDPGGINLLDVFAGTTVTFTPPLRVGDAVQVQTSVGTIPGTYTGQSGTGEIQFTDGISTYFTSNNTDLVNENAPSFSATTFVCFLAGTRIRVPGGDVAVEALAIGDLVLTADGRAVPVKWIGRQTILTVFGIVESRLPIRIEAGALAEDLPSGDLRVTADHALLLDEVLVHAGALVNGTTIRFIPAAELGERFVVFHIETANHELILAEGIPAETFVDNVTRARFDNFAEYTALYGPEETAMPNLPMPRAMSRRQVPAVLRARIAARAAELAGVVTRTA